MAEGPGRRGRAGEGPLAIALRKAARFSALGAGERALFVEAWLRIAWARVFARRVYPAIADAVRITGRGELVGFVNTSSLHHESAPTGPDLARLERLFVLAARHQPGALPCVPRSRALRAFLARRGHRARLRVGVRREARGRLEAHAWTEVDGREVAEPSAVASFHTLETTLR